MSNVRTVDVKVAHPRPSVKGLDMTTVMQGSVNDACEEPLSPQDSDFDFVLPSAKKGLR